MPNLLCRRKKRVLALRILMRDTMTTNVDVQTAVASLIDGILTPTYCVGHTWYSKYNRRGVYWTQDMPNILMREIQSTANKILHDVRADKFIPYFVPQFRVVMNRFREVRTADQEVSLVLHRRIPVMFCTEPNTKYSFSTTPS